MRSVLGTENRKILPRKLGVLPVGVPTSVPKLLRLMTPANKWALLNVTPDVNTYSVPLKRSKEEGVPATWERKIDNAYPGRS
mmetsp:Transcript_5358/g.5584  ORF Transcript_5358/g.5584 Transcript_5358/m.5584 type:complete len:82 (-) Transcript_5358:391-636(-)